MPNRATSSGPVTSGVGLITHGRLTVDICRVLSSDDGKGPKLNTLAKHYLPTSSADDCRIYDLKPGLPIDVFVLYLTLLLLITMANHSTTYSSCVRVALS